MTVLFALLSSSYAKRTRPYTFPRRTRASLLVFTSFAQVEQSTLYVPQRASSMNSTPDPARWNYAKRARFSRLEDDAGVKVSSFTLKTILCRCPPRVVHAADRVMVAWIKQSRSSAAGQRAVLLQ